MFYEDDIDEQIIDKLYQLKTEGFFYLEDDKMITILNMIDVDPSFELHQLLHIFFTSPNDIDTLRLHLSFRKQGNSHRYRMKKKIYEQMLSNREYAANNIELLKSLL